MSKENYCNLDNLDFSRVSVIGCPGSGKTTFTKSLGAVLNRTVIHLDKLLWGANWQMLSYNERKTIHDGIISADNWLIDGMWKSHLTDRLNRATLVIFLDYKRRISFWRAVKRRVKYSGCQREDIADGCLEKLDSYFLHYIFSFRRKVRPVILNEFSLRQNLTVVTLKNPKQTERFLQYIKDRYKSPADIKMHSQS